MNQRFQRIISSRRALLIGGAAFLIVLLLVAGLVWQVLQPKKSVENFCKVLNEEKATLMGDTSDKKKLDAFKRLEAVSPDPIYDDVMAMRKSYQAVVDDPATGLSAGFSTYGSAGRLNKYKDQHCSEN